MRYEIRYLYGPMDGLSEPWNRLPDHKEETTIYGDGGTDHDYCFDGELGAFVLVKSYRPAREHDDCQGIDVGRVMPDVHG